MLVSAPVTARRCGAACTTRAQAMILMGDGNDAGNDGNGDAGTAMPTTAIMMMIVIIIMIMMTKTTMMMGKPPLPICTTTATINSSNDNVQLQRFAARLPAVYCS